MIRLRPPASRQDRDIFTSNSSVPYLSGYWLSAGIAAGIVGDGLLLSWARLRIDVSMASICLTIWIFAAATICYAFRTRPTRPQRIARDLIEGVSLFAIVSLLGAIASYPLATVQHGFVDQPLERIDLDLHFHWINWYELIASNFWLQPLERAAYLSIFVTPAILLGYFAWTGRKAESRLFVATFWVAALVTLSLFPLMPAAGPLATLWHGTMPYVPLSALYQDQVILALRHHAIHDVDLGGLHGLVCAPSFHAASAILYIAAAWRVPVLRWPIVGLNLAMLLATPVEGTHYLVDILCGVLVAVFALTVTPICIRVATPNSTMRQGENWVPISVAAE